MRRELKLNNPCYLGSALISRVYAINHESVKPKRAPLWAKIAGGLLIVLLLAGILYHFSQDREAPRIRDLIYDERIAEGGIQKITLFVNEKNPSDSVILNLNNTSVSVPMVKDYGNGTVVYEKSFDPSIISPKEGKFIGNITVQDKSGNKATKEISFYANLKEPEIKDLKVEKIGLGKYSVSAEISDDSPVKAILQLLNGTEVPLVKTNGRYSANISTLEDLEFLVQAVDFYNLTSSLKGRISVVLRDRFEAWLPSDFDKELSLSLFNSSQLFREIFEEKKFDVLARILKVANLNGTAIPKNLAYQLLDQVERDYRIGNKIAVASKAFEIMEKLKVYNLKNKGSIFIPGNYSAALSKGLPEDLEAFSFLLKTDEAEPEVSYELFNFLPVYIGEKYKGVKLWDDDKEIPIHIYTLGIDLKQSPYLIDYLKSQDANLEFIQGVHRQRNFILYNVLQFDPANQTVRLIYVKPDNDYYFNFLFGKKVFVPEVIDYEIFSNETTHEFSWKPKVIATNVTIEFPLLPLDKGTKMKEWFPCGEDRMVIYACQYPFQLTEFNAKTGELRWRGSADYPWSVEYGRKTLFDDLELVWEGGKWGRFEGKLFDRIIKAYIDKEWKSYETPLRQTDCEGARYFYLGGTVKSPPPEFNYTFTKFLKFYDPKLAENSIVDLGYRFCYGLVNLDGGFSDVKFPDQYRVWAHMLYAKSVGYSITGEAMSPLFISVPGAVHEEQMFPIPKYLLEKFYNNSSIYTPLILPGQSLSPWCDINSLRKDKVQVVYILLPTGRELELNL